MGANQLREQKMDISDIAKVEIEKHKHLGHHHFITIRVTLADGSGSTRWNQEIFDKLQYVAHQVKQQCEGGSPLGKAKLGKLLVNTLYVPSDYDMVLKFPQDNTSEDSGKKEAEDNAKEFVGEMNKFIQKTKSVPTQSYVGLGIESKTLPSDAKLKNHWRKNLKAPESNPAGVDSTFIVGGR